MATEGWLGDTIDMYINIANVCQEGLQNKLNHLLVILVCPGHLNLKIIAYCVNFYLISLY